MRNLTRSLLSLLVMLALTASAEAGRNRWTPIGIGSGPVRALAADPTVPGVLYLAAGPAGLYRSTDSAQTWAWRGLATPFPEDWTVVAVAPADPQRLYAGTEPGVIGSGGVYTSADAGVHWTQLLRIPVGFNAIAVSRDGTLLAAGRSNIVYRSADGGATWAPVLQPGSSAGGQRLRLGFDPLLPQTAYVGAGSALWQSTDGGAHWRAIGTLPGGTPASLVYALAFPGTEAGFLYAILGQRLYRSEDGGATWLGGAPLSGGFSLAVDAADPRTVYAVGFKLLVSHDGGETATEVTGELPPPVSTLTSGLVAVATSPASPSVLYSAWLGIGALVSHDGGGHWSLSEQRGLSALHDFFPGFRVGASGRLYHDPYRFFYRSVDHGATWTPLTPVAELPIYDLIEEAGAPDHLWLATGSVPVRSADGGATWAPSVEAPGARAMASPAPGVVLAGGCGIARSTDGGAHWSQTFPCVVEEEGSLARRSVSWLGAVPGRPGQAWAQIDSEREGDGSTALVVFSQDSGRTWRTVLRRPGGLSTRIVTASQGVLYIALGDVVLRSRDAGIHWQAMGAVVEAITTLAADAADPDLVCAGTRRRGVFCSGDGGRTWADTNAGLARLGRTWIEDLFADPSLPSVFYAVPHDGGVFQIQLAR